MADLTCTVPTCMTPARYLSPHRPTSTWQPRCTLHATTLPFILRGSLDDLAWLLCEPTLRPFLPLSHPEGTWT